MRRTFWTALGKQLSNIDLRAWLKSWLKFTTTAIASFAIGAIMLSIHGLLQGPEKYIVYLIGDAKDQGTRQTHEGFEEHWEKLKPLAVNNIPITIMRERDGGNPDTGKSYAREFAQRSDVLLVVGHGNSSTSKEALKEYMAPKPRIPVILVTETNPDLLPKPCETSEHPCPVLRLSPTDDKQAKKAVQLAMGKKAKSFLVIKDTDNPVYSNYLAKRLAFEITQRNKTVCVTTTDEMTKIRIDMIKTLKIDCVIFVGAHVQAKNVIRWTNKVYRNNDLCPRKPMIILSDWSAKQDLLTMETSELDGVFLTHPRSADEIGDPDVGYKRFGEDTAWIVGRLVSDTNAILSRRSTWRTKVWNWLGYHRVTDVREALALATIKISNLTASPSKEKYSFDRNGQLLDGHFDVWKIKCRKFTEPTGNETPITWCEDTSSGGSPALQK